MQPGPDRWSLPRGGGDRPRRHGHGLALPRRDARPRGRGQAGRPAARRVGDRLGPRLREARSSAALNHRNVVTVFDVVEEDGAVWLVMEYVPSRTLSEIIRDDGALPPGRVAAIGAQVADGLAAAHAAGITHRDVKPGNVLVRDDGLAKISDFGIARTAGDPALTQSGFVSGTPVVLLPELARGADPAPPADVWALGATLYAAVEGRPPYRASNPIAVLHEIATATTRPQRAGRPRARAGLMARDPATRWLDGRRRAPPARARRRPTPRVAPPTPAGRGHAAPAPTTRPAAASARPAPSRRPPTAPADEPDGGRRRRPALVAAVCWRCSWRWRCRRRAAHRRRRPGRHRGPRRRSRRAVHEAGPAPVRLPVAGAHRRRTGRGDSRARVPAARPAARRRPWRSWTTTSARSRQDSTPAGRCSARRTRRRPAASPTTASGHRGVAADASDSRRCAAGTRSSDGDATVRRRPHGRGRSASTSCAPATAAELIDGYQHRV